MKSENYLLFDPQSNVDQLEIGERVILRERVIYMDIIDLDSFSEEDQEILLKIGDDEEGDLVLKRGIIMRYEGHDYNGWPTFNIEGVELDFSGRAFWVERID